MGMSEFMKKMMVARQLDFQEGKFELLGIRGIILPSRTFVGLLEQVYEANGEDMFDFLFDTGQIHGEVAIDEVASDKSLSRREFFSYLFESGNIMGLGELELMRLNANEKELRFSLNESPLIEEFTQSEVLSDIDRPINEFMRGVFHAVADATFDGDITSSETKCAFQGDDHCEFHISVAANSE
jgi:predicted hydrocarbon binding protein